MRAARTFVRSLAFVVMTLFLVTLFAMVRPFGANAASRVVKAWHRTVCLISGVDVIVRGGSLAPNAQLFIANHCSYLDIPVLGGLFDANFIARAEIENWPIMGFLAKLGGTVFVERRRSRVKHQVSHLEGALKRQQKLAFFPEGTSTEGREVMAFKPSLFEPFMNRPDIIVQPISLAYLERRTGMPLCDEGVKEVAWLGDTGFATHLLRLFGGTGVQVVVSILPPVKTTDFPDRKAIATALQSDVSEGLQAALQTASV